MGYTLRAGITAGSLDAGDLGDFAIEDRQVTVGDYDTARQLVQRYPLEWPDGDPGGSGDEVEDEDGDADGDDDPLSPGDSVDVGEPPFDPADYTVDDLEGELEAGDYAAAELAALYSAEVDGKDRTSAKDAIDAHLEG